MGQNLPRMTLLLGPGPGGLTRAASVGLGYAYATRAVDGTDSHLCSVLGLECSAAAIIQAGLKCVMGSRMPSLPENDCTADQKTIVQVHVLVLHGSWDCATVQAPA